MVYTNNLLQGKYMFLNDKLNISQLQQLNKPLKKTKMTLENNAVDCTFKVTSDNLY